MIKLTQTIWARIGFSIEVSEDEKEKWTVNPEQMFKQALESGKAKPDGDSYFPTDLSQNKIFFGLRTEENEIGWN